MDQPAALASSPCRRLVPQVRVLWEARGLPPLSDAQLESLIRLARERASTLPEIMDAVRFFYAPPTHPLSEALSAKLHSPVLALLPTFLSELDQVSEDTEPILETTLKGWARTHSLPLGKVLLTLRLLLTGEESGPSLYAILALLGAAEVRRRLQIALPVYGVSQRL